MTNKKDFIPSEQQSVYFDWIQNGSGSVIVSAVAGSGKTTTLLHGLTLMKGSVFLGAYSKAIAEEMKTRAGYLPDVTISTFHAVGLRFFKRAFPSSIIDADKCKKLYREMLTDDSHKELEGSTLKLVSLAKQSALGILNTGSDQDWFDLMDHFDIEVFDKEGKDKTEQILLLSKNLLTRSIIEDHKVIDFDDMIFAPLQHNVKIFQHDWVLIDEAQDTNVSRRELARRMLKSNGRLVAVGDPRQAIFGFQGASSDSLDQIKNQFNCREIPLSVTYRCPKAVVKYAHQWVDHISAADTAPEGIVRHESLTSLTSFVKPGDAVLCRFNAPLVEQAYMFIKKGIPAMIEGREIAEGLKHLIQRWKSKNFSYLLEKIDEYRDREVEKLKKKDLTSRITSVEDKVACLKVILERVRSIDPYCSNPVDRIVQEIDKIFGKKDDKVPVVTLCSGHRSKGREWNTVVWLTTGISKQAKKDWEIEQENNLCYVMATRAKKELILVDIEKKVSDAKQVGKGQINNLLNQMTQERFGMSMNELHERGRFDEQNGYGQFTEASPW